MFSNAMYSCGGMSPREWSVTSASWPTFLHGAAELLLEELLPDPDDDVWWL